MLLLLLNLLHAGVHRGLHLVPRLSAQTRGIFSLSLILLASCFLSIDFLLLAANRCHTGSSCLILTLVGIVDLFLILNQDHLKLRQLRLLLVELVDAKFLLVLLLEDPLATILVVKVLILVKEDFELDKLLFLTLD